jgi:1-acyl-sn-glycerol-3-phosphate acyltransferase
MGETFYKRTHAVLAPLIKLLWRLDVEGADHVPDEGRAIIASNHLSFMDHLFVAAAVDRPIHFLSKAEHFENPAKAFLFEKLNVIPLERGAGDKEAFHKSIQILEQGKLFGIYPEGTRSPDGRLYKGHTGVARLALTTKSPVVPAAMIDTHHVLPKGELVPSFESAAVRFGEPLYFDEYYGRQNDRKVAREVTDQVMHTLRDLSGQEYVDKKAPHPAYIEDDPGAFERDRGGKA